jgi:peptidylprolyl isomerase
VKHSWVLIGALALAICGCGGKSGELKPAAKQSGTPGSAVATPPSAAPTAKAPSVAASATATSQATTPAVAAPAKSEAPGKTVKTASGLEYTDEVLGTGVTPKHGQLCSVHYTGWLTDGSKFDSSRDRGTPYPFRLGMAEVIKGWDECMSTMKVGGRRRIVVPPHLAYGPSGRLPVIPPNATLVFNVELVEVK